MKQIPLFGTGVKSYSTLATAQRRLNCIYDIRPDGDRSSIILVGTPGCSLIYTLPDAPVKCMYRFQGNVYAVAGTTLFSLSDSSYTTLRTGLGSSNSVVFMTDNGLQLCIVSSDGFGDHGYTYTPSTGVFLTVTDVNFPAGPSGGYINSLTNLDSRVILSKLGSRTFYVSAQLDFQTWTPVIFGTKESSGDPLVRVMEMNGALVLFGEDTLEVWQDVGSSPLPYQRVTGATQHVGLISREGVGYAVNTLVFLGKGAEGEIRIFKLNGYTPVPISTSDIDSILSSLSRINDCTVTTYMTLGHAITHFTFQSANRTLAYDHSSGMWHEAQSGLSTSYAYQFWRWVSQYGVATVARLAADFSTGRIYKIDEAVYTENGTGIRREACTRHIRANGNEVFLSQLMLDFETGVGNGAAPNPTVTINVSRDGGNTFGVAKTKSLGAAASYLTRVVFNRLGAARDFVVRIVVTDPVKFVISGGSAEVEAADD